MDLSTRIGIAQLAAALISSVAMAALAWIAYRHSRRTQQLQAINFYIGNWRELNRFFLENDRAREAKALLADHILTERNDLVALVAIYINQALLAYYTWKFKVLPKEELDEEFKAIWAVIQKEIRVAADLIKEESYPPKFKEMFLSAMPSRSMK